MKGKKLYFLIAGIVLFLVGLVWILMVEGWWLNWLILVVGVVLFILSFIGKENATPAAPETPVETAPEAPTETPKEEV